MAISKWSIDPAHSNIIFKAKHMMITTVTGSFNSFSADAEFDESDITGMKLHFSADVASINTGNNDRNGHLMSPEFFDAATYPAITFDASRVEKAANGQYRITGAFAMHGVSKETSFDLEFAGVAKDPWGNTKAGFILKGTVNRKDWGLTWNVALETGGILVSEEIQILCEVQMAKQA